MSDTKALRDLAAFVNKHPEVLSLLPKGQSGELDALCKRFADKLEVDPSFMMKRGIPPASGHTHRERPADIHEHRHRVACSVINGPRAVAVASLSSDAAWFASCVGIHSVRVVGFAHEDQTGKAAEIKFASISQDVVSSVEWGDPRDVDLFDLWRIFAHGEIGNEMRPGALPFASSFNPDRHWLAIPNNGSKGYSLKLVFTAPVKSVEVEFTCMLARRAPEPPRAPGQRIIMPHIDTIAIDAQILVGSGSFSFKLPPPRRIVGFAFSPAPCGEAGVATWSAKEVRMFNDEDGVCVARWDHARMRNDNICRKFGGDVKASFSLGPYLCEFGPFMRDADRAITIDYDDELTVRIDTGRINCSEKPMKIAMNLYLLRHASIVFE
jgi:hypothetical protein